MNWKTVVARIRLRLTGCGWLWPAAVITLLAALAARPLMRPVMTCSHDGGLHVLRLIELDHLIRNGQLYPRWMPHLAYGYGYPLFNFYAPLSWYVAQLFRLGGLSTVLAWNAALALCLLAAGLFTYLLARDWMSQRGALVAAAAYLLAPYLLYDVYFRGNLAESMALSLLPLLLWAFGRLVRLAGARYLALAAASLAALILTHQVMFVLFAPLLVVFVWLVWGRGRRIPWRLLIAFTAGLLALGLSAFFWLPAFLEKEAVQIAQAITPGGMNYRHNFLTLAELLSPPVAAPQGLLNPSPPRSLSLAALGLGLLGLLPLAVRLARYLGQRFRLAFPIFARDVSGQVRRAWHLFALGYEPSILRPACPPPSRILDYPDFEQPFAAEQRQLGLFAALLALAFMTLAPSLPLWERIPLFGWAQFPWRFLGPASLALALMAGNSLSLLPADTRRRWLSLAASVAAVTLVLVFSLGWLYPRDCTSPGETVAAIPRFERATGIIGTTSAGEYLPRHVQELPSPETLTAMIQAGEPVVRLDPDSLPQGAVVEQAQYGLTSARLLVQSPAPFRAVYRAFYFPGWRVAINGQNAPIIVTAPHGLISFDVPAGQAAVQVWFGATPLRLASWLLSGATLLMVLWLAWQGRREGRLAPASAWAAAPWPQWAILLAAVGGLWWARAGWIDRGANWFRPAPFDGQTLQNVDLSLDINLGGELALLGYNLPRRQVAAGEAVEIELFWAARKPPSADYAFSVRLVDGRGLEWSPKGTRRPGGYHDFPQTQSWQPGEYARDPHLVDVLPGTPPGRYTLRITAFERQTLVGLDVLDDQGAPLGQSVDVAEVIVTAPRRPLQPEELGADVGFEAPLGEVTLLGLSLGRWQATPGDALHVTTFWRADEPPGGDYTVEAELVDGQGQVATRLSFSPGGPQYPTSAWQPGQVIRDQQVWPVPASLSPGRYILRFRAQNGASRLFGPVGLPGVALDIVALERQTALPDMARRVDANLAGLITLLGYDLTPAAPRPGDTLVLTLYWRAEREIARSYKVFVHLLDSAGRMAAQHDAVPANWTRPTTGWLPGEIVTDVHLLALPAGTASGALVLEVGLYDEQTATRLSLLDETGQTGEDRMVLETVRLP